MALRKYQFPDYSYHKGRSTLIQPVLFPAQGYRLVVPKASDSYHMPVGYNPDGTAKFDIAADYHTDLEFAGNFDKARAAGLVVATFHFCRWDRPWKANSTTIVAKNLEYFQIATEGRVSKNSWVILDMEQSETQLKAAGLTPAAVTNMAKQMVEIFKANYAGVIIYSYQHWWNTWITDPAWFAARCTLWKSWVTPIFANTPINPFANPPKFNGFSDTYATSVETLIGNTWAWQFTFSATIAGFPKPGIDLNTTDMPKEQLALMFDQDIAVDPPDNPSSGDCTPVIADILGDFQSLVNSKKAKYGLS